jgi:hypothetical protein
VNGVADAIIATDAEQIRQLAFGIVVNNQVEAVEFLNPDGQPILSMRHIAGGKVEEYKFSKGGDINFGQYQFVSDVLNRQVDNLGDKYSGLVHANRGDYLYVSGPVYSREGDFAGVLMVGITLQSLVRQLREETLSGITVYNFGGVPLASTFSTPSLLDTNIISTVVAQASQSSFKRGLDRRELNISNLDYEEILTPWRARNGIELGILGSSLAKTFLMAQVR